MIDGSENLKEYRAACRIVDANANRLREALRAVEEYFRFAQSNRKLTAELKSIRHRLAAGLSPLEPEELLRARKSMKDVGKRTLPSESSRESLKSIAWINLKRGQEAARVLEEYGKLLDRKSAEIFKQIRFSLYEFEKKFIL